MLGDNMYYTNPTSYMFNHALSYLTEQFPNVKGIVIDRGAAVAVRSFLIGRNHGLYMDSTKISKCLHIAKCEVIKLLII